ncbi:MAG: hypothetical protein GX891_03675 [Clostridiales bacterium]|nr:hypothetical protein [Clostridiales bacterium]
MAVDISNDAVTGIAIMAGGDLRTALNALELAILTTKPDKNGVIKITTMEAAEAIQKKTLGIDESSYYDMLSAFIKSMRGSDSSAAVYWSERLLEAGCDPMLVARRVVIHASEDVGLADPLALVIATSAMTALQNIGLPEGKIPLTQAIIYISEAPKSNSVVRAIDAADTAVKMIDKDIVPIHLRDPNFKGEEKVNGYKYPHDYGGYVPQQYLPTEIKDMVIYDPTDIGYEKAIRERAANRLLKAKRFAPEVKKSLKHAEQWGGVKDADGDLGDDPDYISQKEERPSYKAEYERPAYKAEYDREEESFEEEQSFRGESEYAAASEPVRIQPQPQYTAPEPVKPESVQPAPQPEPTAQSQATAEPTPERKPTAAEIAMAKFKASIENEGNNTYKPRQVINLDDLPAPKKPKRGIGIIDSSGNVSYSNQPPAPTKKRFNINDFN